MDQPAKRLASEDVVVAAPFSLAGSAVRIWRFTRRATDPAPRAALIALAVVLIVLAWAFVLCWYAVFGVFLVPYRLVRRGARKRKREALQHREQLAALESFTAGRCEYVSVNGHRCANPSTAGSVLCPIHSAVPALQE